MSHVSGSDHMTDGGVAGVDRRHRLSDLYHERTNFRFLARRRLLLTLFLVVVIGGPLLLLVRPLNLGIDFRGGVAWQVEVPKDRDVSVAKVRDILDATTIEDYKATISSSPQSGQKTIRVQAQVVNDAIETIREQIARATGVKTSDVTEASVGGNQSFSVAKAIEADKAKVEKALTPAVLSGAKATVTVTGQQVTVALDKEPKSERQVVSENLAKYAGAKTTDVSISTVGPTWGGEVSRKALTALLVFFVVLALYLSIRFEFKMAMAALVAVMHDIVFTVAVYAISQFTVSPATVTAFLTILGFSLYDTVVVFDKIKENEGALTAIGRSTYRDMATRSLNEVLMRSLSTSFVALLPVFSLLVVGVGFFGATSLEDFALALFFGLLVGSYSSIFVATPALVWWKEREPQYRALSEKQAARAAGAARSVPKETVAAASDVVNPQDWDPSGVAGPPAVMRPLVAPKARQTRGRKRK